MEVLRKRANLFVGVRPNRFLLLKDDGSEGILDGPSKGSKESVGDRNVFDMEVKVVSRTAFLDFRSQVHGLRSSIQEDREPVLKLFQNRAEGLGASVIGGV